MAPFPLARKVVMSVQGRNNFDSLSDEFINKFNPKQHDIIIEAFLQTDCRTRGAQSPRPFQIECAVALKTGQDLMCTAGCGMGKTLAMALPVMLLDDRKMAITLALPSLKQYQELGNLPMPPVYPILASQHPPNLENG
jgi:superfamily II DNA/RNA helicase